ncbi:MAG: sensor histidine kinase [Promethearchaeota archaeon]
MSSKTMDLNITKENIYKIIQKSVSNFMLLINKKKIGLKILVDEELYLNIDSFRISQVFSNLIINAIKFTGENGEIIISAEKLPNKYLFKIKDSGKGLNKDEIQFLLITIMYMDDHLGNISAFKKSAGLRLYIAKRIVSAHGGDIWIRSERIGKGAEICFFLPIK